ncbi:MAG: UDP-N-acetyl-2-amino-2-deoxyglucuronate dehydrogenase [Pseudothermotoga sp.]|jgi:predicted dehydrogenase|nr:UDP-N-acetyl-2-amino-2-deoxyglucuronate dehydrogenase [Pseudothermotoga sp.]MDK2883901.1 UDP-N-acetyl-2-amino-2-deoxyglucuronate dehydrogenase [Pseudothermotoga sp.]HBJ81091.1 oxidoreductase [Pseudothermotoga sp.]HBT25440.1 oxidoreductase [Pseudothermotoga sp.]
MGLIGCGRIASKHLEAVVQNSDIVQISAVCDVVPERAQKASLEIKDKLGYKPEIYIRYEELLQRDDINFVAIATPSGTHYQISVDALEMGKHVLVEKPMALSTDHMQHMVDLSKKKGLKIGVCFQNRFNPPVQELRRKIESGSFGKIFYGTINVRWNRKEEYYKQASWRGTWEQDGGALMNQSIHGIDLLQWMLGGKPKRVVGIIKNLNHPYIEAEDLGIGIVEFESGAVGIVEGTSNIYDRNLEEILSIFGERGTVKIGGVAVNRILSWRFVNEENHPYMNLPDPDTVYGSGHVSLYRDFCEALLYNREPYISGEEGKKAVEIVLALYKSFVDGKWVSLPVDFSTEKMKG